MADTVKTIWAISNRQDDRTVLWEVDAQHPSGEAFLGGAGPDHVAVTPAIAGLLRTGEIIEIPEPPESNKKPIDYPAVASFASLAQPGQPVKLGRTVDPALLAGPSAQKAVEKAQEAAPDAIAVPNGVIVPPAETAKS